MKFIVKNVLVAACSILLAEACISREVGSPKSSQLLNKFPKDYALSRDTSRVKDLVNFFERVRQSSEDPRIRKDLDVVLSLSDSATKLYTLTYGLPHEMKCDKMVKLLERPNIRTVGTISLLMKESRSFDEMNQGTGNLIAQLVAARNYDALARVQSILLTLESEQTLGKSNFELYVQKLLLDCINYYTYRYQRATDDVINYTRENIDRLPRSALVSSKSELTLKQLVETVESVEAIEKETKNGFRYNDWLQGLSALNRLALESDYELPDRVREFLTDSRRIHRLNLIDRGHELKQRLDNFESQVDFDARDEEYLSTLLQLVDLCKDFADILLPDICEATRVRNRLRLLERPNEPVRYFGTNDVPSMTSGAYGTQPSSVDFQSGVSDELSENETLVERKFFRAAGEQKMAERLMEADEIDEASQEIPAIIRPRQQTSSLASITSPEKYLPQRWQNASLHFQRKAYHRKKRRLNRPKPRPRGPWSTRRMISLTRNCLENLNKARIFIVNFDHAKTEFADLANAGKLLAEFKVNCLNNKTQETRTLRSNLIHWCERNPKLTRKKDCEIVIDLLD